MQDVSSLFSSLCQQELFRKWSTHHAKAYLTHFFSPFSSKNPNPVWEIGFYDPLSAKITVFTQLKTDFAIKPEDDVFKQEETKVEELKLECLKISCERAFSLFQEHKEEYFPKEIIGDGFVILQTIDRKLLWNFTFITKTLKFVNLKIDANSGIIESNQMIDLVMK